MSFGDGTNAAVDPTNPVTAYLALPEASIKKTTDDSVTLNDITGPDGPTPNPSLTDKGRLPFVTTMTLDQSNTNRLLVGTYRLWETTDGGATWRPTGTQDLTGGSGTVSAIAIAPTMTSTVYVGTDTGLIQASMDDGATFTSGGGLPGRYVAAIAVSPSTPTTAWAGISGFNAATPGKSGHVFQTTNGGQTWSAVSGAPGNSGLPDVPVNDVAAGADGRVYVATDTGVFVSSNATSANATWTPLGTGLPNTPTFALNLRRDGLLFASTHGCGLMVAANASALEWSHDHHRLRQRMRLHHHRGCAGSRLGRYHHLHQPRYI